jgi:hypothetical protein
MKNVIKLNEKDLSRIVKRVMKENIYSQEDLEMMRDPEFQKNDYYEPFGRDLKGKIMELIHNSNSSNEEMISILRGIADDMESSRSLRNDVKDRWNK